jgi:hypothetical protein
MNAAKLVQFAHAGFTAGQHGDRIWHIAHIQTRNDAGPALLNQNAA